MRGLFCLPTMLLCAAVSMAGDTWPQFRGPTGDGVSDAENLPTTWSEKENVRWKTAIHDKGWSSPVVWGNQVWLTTAMAEYADKNAKEFPMKKEPKPLFVDFYAVCVDRKTGKVVRDIKLFREDRADYCHSYNSYATPTPVIEEGRLYVHFGAHGTLCLDTATGKTLWERRDLKVDHFRGPGSSPIADDKFLFLTFDGFDRQYVAALDKKTGATAWLKDRGIDYKNDNGDWKKAYSTPTIVTVNGKRQLVSPAAEATVAYDPATGAELWRVTTGGMNQASKPLEGDGLIFLTTGNKKGMIAVREGAAGRVEKSGIAWETTKGAPTRPSALFRGDRLYWVSDEGTGYCVDAKTGKQAWSNRMGGATSASPILAGGKVYSSDEAGLTCVFDAAPELGDVVKNRLDDGCMASPAVAGDAIFLRTKTHLYCLAKAK